MSIPKDFAKIRRNFVPLRRLSNVYEMDRDMDLEFRKDIEDDLEKDNMPQRMRHIVIKAEDWEDLPDVDVSNNDESEEDLTQ